MRLRRVPSSPGPGSWPVPVVMGILNVTPDSFFDGGRFVDRDRAVEHGMEMAAQGALIVDVGGESTRPGAEAVSEDEELRRVVDVVAELSRHVAVSIDTTKARVAERALEAGASVVNDVSASLESVAGAAGVPWIAMHSRGSPKTMSTLTDYHDVVGEVRDYLRRAVDRGMAAGVPEVWVDPGIGFAKTAHQCWELVAAVGEIVADGAPVLLGASRKSFLSCPPEGRWDAGAAREAAGAVPQATAGHGSPRAADKAPGAPGSGARQAEGGSPARTAPSASTGPDDRLEGSLAVATWAMTRGVSVVRAHDVAATVAAARLVSAGRIGGMESRPAPPAPSDGDVQ